MSRRGAGSGGGFLPWLLFLLACLRVGAGGQTGAGRQVAAPRNLMVFAAASLTEAFDALADEFEAGHAGVTVLRNYASSSTLAAQLLAGEVADVFASANSNQMAPLVEAGLTAPGGPAIFAANRLVVIVPAENPAGVGSCEDLGRLSLALVLASPGVPVREYADQMATRVAATRGEAFRERFYANLVSEEANVRQVAAKVALGEADAGIVYSTDVTRDIAQWVRRFEVPDRFNVIATYPIAALAQAPQPALAAEFVQFVLGADGRRDLARYGFGEPPQER